MKKTRRLAALVLALLLALSLASAAFADKADFEYKLIVTDGDGRTVTNPRSMSAGDTLNIEIELTRTDTNANSYETYGLEFRLRTRGLQYNNDGASFRSGTGITEQKFEVGDSVGFAYYDMDQVGERIANPVLAGKWSYTVTDPGSINITVPVAVMYIVNDSESYEPVGNAILYLDPNGGQIVGEDVSGEYRSGTIVTLPDAEFAEYNFLGWSDGVNLYQPGANFTVSGIVTLTAQWEGLVRDRQVIFDPDGGEFVDDDPSGLYADGEIIPMPEVTKEGFVFDGWDLYGETYQLGDEYVVDNSVVFQAQWTETEGLGENDTPTTQGGGWFTNEDGTPNNGHIAWGIILGLLLLGLLFLLFLLWKRRWVLYSLKDGSIALDYKDNEHDYRVEVILIDDEGKEITLDQSRVIEKKHKLRYIPGKGPDYVVQIDPGKYKGKLIITDNDWTDEKKCRIKVLDREIRERENK